MAVGEVEQGLVVVGRGSVLGILVETQLPFVQHAVKVDPRPAVVRARGGAGWVGGGGGEGKVESEEERGKGEEGEGGRGDWGESGRAAESLLLG